MRQPNMVVQRLVVSEISKEQAIQLSSNLRSIFDRAFGRDNWKEDRILTLFPDWTDIFLCVADGLPVAYCNITLRSFQAPDDFLWVESMAVDRAYQKGGLGQNMLRCALDAHLPAKWIGARTQNPSFIRLMQHFCSPLFPIDISYQSTQGRAILMFSQVSLLECKTADEHGVCKGAYREGRLGNYPEREELLQIHEMYAKYGVHTENGDAVIVIGERKYGTSKFSSESDIDTQLC